MRQCLRTVLWQSPSRWRVDFCYGEDFRGIEQWLLCPSHCQCWKVIFLYSHRGNLVRFLEVKVRELWGLPKSSAPEVLTLTLAHIQPPTLHRCHHLIDPTSLQLQGLQLRQADFCCCISLQVLFSLGFKVALPHHLVSLMDPRKVVGFQFFQLFVFVKDKNSDFFALFILDLKLEAFITF